MYDNSANASGMEVEPKTIITDADFFDMKLTQVRKRFDVGAANVEDNNLPSTC